jgi:hypothetical protein
MSGPKIRLSHPDLSETQHAQEVLRGHVQPELVPHLLLLSRIAEYDREPIIEAAQRVSVVPLRQRGHLFSMLSRVPVWRGNGHGVCPSNGSSTPASFYDARSSFASATSTLPSSVASPSGSRQSHGAVNFCRPTNGTASNKGSHYASPVPHTLPGNCTPPHAPTAGVPVTNPPHSFASQTTNPAAYQAVNPKSLSSQQASEHQSTSSFGRIKEKLKRKTQTAINVGTPDLPKWVCPVCCKGLTRADTMKAHIKNQCLSPKTYQCLSCTYSNRRKDCIIKHCKDTAHVPALGFQAYTPPARKIYASCITGKLYSTDDELIDDTYQHCLQSKDIIPLSDPNIRTRALFSEANSKLLNQEMEKQCSLWYRDPKAWLTLIWKREDALRYADMAEYGLHCDAPSISSDGVDNSIEVTGSNLEQHKLGIADLSAYVTDVLFSSLGDQNSPVLGQSPAVVMPGQSTAGFNSFTFDAQARDFTFSRPTPSNRQDSLHEQTHDQDHTQPHAPTYEDHDSQPGWSSNRYSVVMQDWPLPNEGEFDGNQASYNH